MIANLAQPNTPLLTVTNENTNTDLINQVQNISKVSNMMNKHEITQKHGSKTSFSQNQRDHRLYAYETV